MIYQLSVITINRGIYLKKTRKPWSPACWRVPVHRVELENTLNSLQLNFVNYYYSVIDEFSK